MSGHSSDTQCPECDGLMQTYSDYKPFDQVSGNCLECGFAYFTHTLQLDLEEVNEARREMELKPMLKLKEKKRRV